MITLWTAGHSTRPSGDFISMLEAHGIRRLADIRTVPRSARNPQFSQDILRATLDAAGIEYLHIPDLGGLRRPRKDSANTAWKNDAFRGYADHMQSSGFRNGLERLLAGAEQNDTAMMCAESVPWRCHRSLVADALAARGIQVLHIMSAGAVKPHSLTPFAHIEGESVTYPGLPVPLVE